MAIASTKSGEIEFTEAGAGLTESELCARPGLTIYQANKAAKEQRMTGDDYLFKVTGWKPSEGKRPRYHPAKD